MKKEIIGERSRNGATQTTPESNQMASSASPSPPCSPSSFSLRNGEDLWMVVVLMFLLGAGSAILIMILDVFKHM